MTGQAHNQYPGTRHLPRKAAALALAGLMLIGCNDRSTEQPKPASETTTPFSPQAEPPVTEVAPSQPAAPGEQLSAADCSLRYVQPGLNFSEENGPKLAEDLALIMKLEQDTGEVRIRDILTAGRIIKDSYQDPLYAQAMLQAREKIASGGTVGVDEFLQTPVVEPRRCDENHIEKSASRAQLHQTTSLSQSLIRRMGERLGNNVSRLTRQAYEGFQREVDQLRDRAEQIESTPSN